MFAKAGIQRVEGPIDPAHGEALEPLERESAAPQRRHASQRSAISRAMVSVSTAALTVERPASESS